MKVSRAYFSYKAVECVKKNDWGQEYLLYGMEHHVRTRNPTITSCDFLVIEQSSSFQGKCNQVPFLKTLNLLVRSNMGANCF